MPLGLDTYGAGEPLVVIHGVGTTRRVWREAGPLLARQAGLRVIAPDVPGFGDAPPVGQGFDLDLVADGIADGLQLAAASRFDLLGHSMGGAIALRLTARRPDAVRRLILSAPAGFSPMPAALARAAGALAPAALHARRLAGEALAGSAFARRALLFGAVGDGATLEPEVARQIMRGPLGAQRLGQAVSEIAMASARDDLASLDRPYAVVWGTRDRIIPIAIARRMSSIRSPVAIEEVSGAGHVSHLEHPAEFAAATARALEAITAS